MKRLSALLGAGAMLLAMTGTALAATGPSDQGITPTAHEGNIKLDASSENQVQADCTNTGTAEDPEWEGIETLDAGGSDTSPGGVTVTWTYDETTKEFGFSATGGLVSIAYIKGGNIGYNEYDYTGEAGGGVASDGGMFAPDNSPGNPAGLSHAVFCTTPGEEPSDEPSFEQSQEGETDPPSDAPSFEQSQEGATEPSTDGIGTNGTSGPADGAWLLVVALGVLLGSVVVLTPARAKSRR